MNETSLANKSLNYLKDDESLNGSLNASPSLRNKNFLFNILTNKPKIPKNESYHVKPAYPAMKNQESEFASIKSNMVDYVSSPSKSKKPMFYNSDSIRSDNGYSSMNNSTSNTQGIARIRSNGGLVQTTASILNNSASFMSQDEDTENDYSDCKPVGIDYTSEDYVVTRL